MKMMNRPPNPGGSFPGSHDTTSHFQRQPNSGFPTGTSAAGRLSPSLRGLGNGSLPTPPPLGTPNSTNTPTSEPADVQAAATAAQVSVFSENGTTYFYNP